MNLEKDKQENVIVRRDWIIEFRNKFGLNQTELGRLIDVPQTSISYWEKGRAMRGSSKVLQLALERLSQILEVKKNG